MIRRAYFAALAPPLAVVIGLGCAANADGKPQPSVASSNAPDGGSATDEPPAPALSCTEPIPCVEPLPSTASSRGKDKLSLVRATFSELPDWGTDSVGDAVPAFMASCAALAQLADSDPIGVSPYAGKKRDWKRACKKARGLPAGDHDAARTFFEKQFKLYAAHSEDGPTAKFSGYYVQSLRASRKRSRRYRFPLYSRPTDLAEVQLSDFVRDGRGRRIWGRFDSGKLMPYPTRPELRRAGFPNSKVILWADSGVDTVFTEIQGSGRAVLDDGSEVWLAFDGKNGRKFRGVGGILRRMGELARGQGTMQGTRKWFDKNPRRYHEIVDKNPAKVFFKISDRAGAIGTQGVVLTPRRSIAIDRAVIGFSTPIFVDARAPVAMGKRKVGPFRKLMIAQDTGGAIIGPIRGDLYFGADAEAADIAGRTGGKGRMWLLLPKALEVPTK